MRHKPGLKRSLPAGLVDQERHPPCLSLSPEQADELTSERVDANV